MPKKKNEKSVKNRKSTKSISKPKVVKAKVLDPDKPSEKMSRRMLDSYVRRHGKELNKTLEKYRKNPSEWANVDDRYKRVIERVQEAGTGRGIGKPKVGLGYREKKKEELLLLARRIQEAERFSIDESEEGQEEKFNRHYESFVRDHVDAEDRDKVTPEVYREMVDVFGASGNLLQDFGYEDYIQLVTDKIVEGYMARDVIRTAREIMDDITDKKLMNPDGTGMTTEDALDELRKRLGG
jgi:hypothetical protein